MDQTNISVCIDKNLKKQFDAFCSDVGMSMTTAFCIFAKTVVREQRIPFEISVEKEAPYSSARVHKKQAPAAYPVLNHINVNEVSPNG